jgi:hypothetical protein
MKILSTKTVSVCAVLVASAFTLQAEDIFQIANSPNGWNSADYWGAEATAGNNYFTTALGSLINELVVDGFTWTLASGAGAIGTVRDSPDPGSSSTFAGDSLTLSANTRILSKVKNGSTSTANLIFGGGFFMSGTNSGGSATLAGTLSFATGINLGAIAVNRGQPVALTVSSTLIGGPDDTLQLSLFSESAIVGASSIIFNGDLSNFSGTLYVGTSTTHNGSNPSSFYSVYSSSAATTLIIDTASFAAGGNKYHLDNNVTFGSLIVGGVFLDPGTYTYADLELLAPGSFLDNGGSITVIPEPSSIGLCLVALGGLFLYRRATRVTALRS